MPDKMGPIFIRNTPIITKSMVNGTPSHNSLFTLCATITTPSISWYVVFRQHTTEAANLANRQCGIRKRIYNNSENTTVPRITCKIPNLEASACNTLLYAGPGVLVLWLWPKNLLDVVENGRFVSPCVE